MLTLKFIGKVLPSAYQVSVAESQAKWDDADIGLQLNFTVRIVKSAVNIEIKTSRFNPPDLSYFYIRALDLARASVNLVGFAAGLGLFVVIDAFIDPNGKETSLAFIDQKLANLCTAYKVNTNSPQENAEFQKMAEVVMSVPALFMALDDLIVSITLPHHASVNCARAVEGIRALLAPNVTPRHRAWAILREALRIEAPYVEFITERSIANRHGDRQHIPGDVTTEIAQRAWKIMNRYLEFLKRGSQPLPESEFPLLS